MIQHPVAETAASRRSSRASAISRRTVLATAAGTAGSLATGSGIGAGAQAGDAQADDAPADRRVVSYYTGWSRYDREFYPADVPLESITDLNYAFLTVEEDGTVAYADEWGDQENLAALADRAGAHPDTSFHLSIGGWNDSTHFSDAAATAANRERFASTAIELLREYGFDGIDVDWEYPGGGGRSGNVTREDDPENLVLLLEELRAQLDDAEAEDDAEYGITMAASANSSTAGALPIADLEPYLDYVTVMTYDFAGGWSSETGHNAPLHGDGPSVAGSMQWWAEQPIPGTKLCVGLPFYGQVFTGVADGDGGRSTDGLGLAFDGNETVRFAEIDRAYSVDGSYERYWDETAAAPYLYSADEETFVSYDDAESIGRTVDVAVDGGFGGVMVWEQSGDPDGALLAVVDEHLGGDGENPDCDGVAVEGGTEVVDGQTVCDVNDDGYYRDVTGDGEVGQGDVAEFFTKQHRSAWKRPELFDVSGNGAVTHGDVVELFDYVALH